MAPIFGKIEFFVIFQKFNFLAIFEIFQIIFFLHSGQLDNALNGNIKESEHNDPKHVFSWDVIQPTPNSTSGIDMTQQVGLNIFWVQKTWAHKLFLAPRHPPNFFWPSWWQFLALMNNSRSDIVTQCVRVSVCLCVRVFVRPFFSFSVLGRASTNPCHERVIFANMHNRNRSCKIVGSQNFQTAPCCQNPT